MVFQTIPLYTQRVFCRVFDHAFKPHATAPLRRLKDVACLCNRLFEGVRLGGVDGDVRYFYNHAIILSDCIKRRKQGGA